VWDPESPTACLGLPGVPNLHRSLGSVRVCEQGEHRPARRSGSLRCSNQLRRTGAPTESLKTRARDRIQSRE
jgi:hypothetical protein